MSEESEFFLSLQGKCGGVGGEGGSDWGPGVGPSGSPKGRSYAVFAFFSFFLVSVCFYSGWKTELDTIDLRF